MSFGSSRRRLSRRNVDPLLESLVRLEKLIEETAKIADLHDVADRCRSEVEHAKQVLSEIDMGKY